MKRKAVFQATWTTGRETGAGIGERKTDKLFVIVLPARKEGPEPVTEGLEKT